MRVMSLDVGTKTIGVAASDLMRMIAGGIETIRRTSPQKDFERIGQLIKEYEVDTLVVGYPKNMNGTVGEKAQLCAAFAQELRSMFTGVEADLRRKKRRKVIDMMAAVVILQNYLDSCQLRSR